jgi:hypothetical protein
MLMMIPIGSANIATSKEQNRREAAWLDCVATSGTPVVVPPVLPPDSPDPPDPSDPPVAVVTTCVVRVEAESVFEFVDVSVGVAVGVVVLIGPPGLIEVPDPLAYSVSLIWAMGILLGSKKTSWDPRRNSGG